MLRDLLARAALGLLAGSIAVSCMKDEPSAENVGEVQQALAGAANAAGAPGAAGEPGAGGAPIVGNPGAGGADAGAGGQPEPACDPVACADQGACMHCNPNNDKCEPYKASDDQPCGTVVGECDAQDYCDGGAECPDVAVRDEGEPCGNTTPDPANLCDLPDECDGQSKLCPNTVKAVGTVCRPEKAGSLCDVAETCNGGINCPADGFKDSTVPCRSKSLTNPCDVADSCPGDGPDCTDGREPDDTACPNGSTNLCLDPLTTKCLGGTCSAGELVACQRAPGQCEEPGICVPGTGLCLFTAKPNNTPCDDNIDCTENDHCNNNKVCVSGTPNHQMCQPPSGTGLCGTFTCDPTVSPIDFPDFCRMTPKSETSQCRPAGGFCGLAELCDGDTAECPEDQFKLSTVECRPASCLNGVATVAAQCPGDANVCPAVTTASCNGFACDDAGAACLTTCADDDDCMSTHYCAATGNCEERIGIGEACDAQALCGVGTFCVDGVCCDTECDEQCEACDVEGQEGTCSAVSGEPHGEREACQGDGSVCSGACNGQLRSACEVPDAQTVCQAAACDASTGIALEQAFCDGVGACALTDPVECAPFVCGATACRGDCSTDAQCATGAFCKAGVCTPNQDEGDRCTRDAQCGSGFCSDGVCCESRCAGQCESCNAAGACVATQGAPVGTRPACAGADGDVCAGECDGQNRLRCGYPGPAVVCREATCALGEATVAAHCSGSGTCAPAQSVICPNGCEGAICAGDACVVNGDCPAQERCVAGTCAPRGEPGGSCSSASDCASGFCVDGVCCESACDGQCEACDVSGKLGSCSPVDGAPHGSRPPCTSDGSACGGTCDGENVDGCSYPSGTVCGAGSCAPGEDGAEAVATVEAQCNGSGRCPAPRQQACGGFGCDAAEELCNGDCADGSACAGGEYCSAGVCVATEPNGTACQADQQCKSGQCVDGYCCSSACDDRCAACDVPGELGKCTPVTGSTHGGRPGCQGGGACGAQCDGKSVTSCSFPGEDTSCSDPYCHDGAQVGASVCDGAGQCQAGEQTACAAFGCDGDQCSDACETDADCTRTLQCSAGKCVEPFIINAVDEGTCGCRTPGGQPARSGAWLLALGALAVLSARRRSRPRAA